RTPGGGLAPCDGGCPITIIHVDSCFYQSPENGRLQPLEAHERHSLKFGDSFSLMVDKYIFKVLSAQPVESTERYQYLPVMILFSVTVPFRDDNESEQSTSIQRKRLLPSWMLEQDLLVPRISEPITKGGKFGSVVCLYTNMYTLMCILKHRYFSCKQSPVGSTGSGKNS
uniref:Uncharacterized protein n=1 Tax=Coturnix japonica TaxID=93934 RepID=A0A8C2TK36_COTJA